MLVVTAELFPEVRVVREGGGLDLVATILVRGELNGYTEERFDIRDLEM